MCRPMKLADQRKRIRQAYQACQRLYQKHRSGWADLLEQAVEAAEKGERQHRRGRPNEWRQSVPCVAKWFAVKWFLDVAAYAPPEDWASAVEIRPDCLLAYAAMSQVLRGIGEHAATEVDELREAYADVLAYDYTSWVRQ